MQGRAVEPDAPSASRLDAFRGQADHFLTQLNEEYYLHFAGLKESLDLEPIYAEHEELTELEQAKAIGRAVDGGGGRVRELWRFACEGHIGALTRAYEEQVAQLEAELEVDLDGERVPFRMIHPRLANEPNRAVRERLAGLRGELMEEHLNPIYEEALSVTHQAASTLGASSYVDLYRRFGFQLDTLAEQCRTALRETEDLYERAADRLFRTRVGVGLDEAGHWDVPRLFRAPQWDSFFPKDAMVPALEATLADLGIELRRQRNVELDLDDRPLKSPRAFCSTIEVPARIVLVIKPIGGADDWLALFHEAGHTEHFAHTSAHLPLESRRLGDNAVTEGWAALFEKLVEEPAWQDRRLDMPRAADFASEGATLSLYFLRRYCAKLLYELELHEADDPRALRERYVELLSDAVKIEPAKEGFLADVDSGFYASSYLRSWAFEAQLREQLREQFGAAWFSRRQAGNLLRELWSEGQGLDADEVLREVAGANLELAAVGARAAEAL